MTDQTELEHAGLNRGPDRKIRADFRRAALCCGLMGLLLVQSSGCAAGPGRIANSPLTVGQQQKAILEIVPLGTPRLDAIRKLTEAGLELSPGTSESTYYCDVWNRQDGQRWRVDVALLFDETGVLYGTKQAQSTTSLDTDSAAGKGRPAGAVARTPAAASRSETGTASAPVTAGSRTSKPRTPFVNPTASTKSGR